MWVIKTKHTGTLFAARNHNDPSRPCVIVFETKQHAMQMRNMIQLMRPQSKPHQPLVVENWAIASVTCICNYNALDVMYYKKEAHAQWEQYPAERDCNEDVRFSLDCIYMYGGSS